MSTINIASESSISLFDCEPGTKLSEYSLPLDELKDSLIKYGVTGSECKVFIFLGKYGLQTASEISVALKIQRTEVYRLLDSLRGKGVVSSQFDKPTRFFAIPFGQALMALINAEKSRVRAMEMQKNYLSDLWQQIPNIKQDSELKYENKFDILKGADTIACKIDEMIEGAQETLRIIGTEKFFYKLYHYDTLIKIKKASIDFRFLTTGKENSLYVFDKIKNAKIKHTTDKIEKNLCFVIKDSNELLLFIGEDDQNRHDVTAAWTDCSSMICPLNLLFNYIWSVSKCLRGD